MTNRGSAVTNRTQWTDTVWLTKDRTRPSPGPRSVLSAEGAPIVIPGNDAVLLGSFAHSGSLAVGESYEQVVKVRIPQQIESGTYYITAWADAYDAVFEDSLASNVNPDDPGTLDSSNFKARAIDVIGPPEPPLPDLQVVAITTNGTSDAPASVDKPFTVTWTVRNLGEGVAIGVGGSWYDSVFLHTTPGILDQGANVWMLGSFERVRSLDPLASYTNTKTFDLSPATQGLYVTVIADTNPMPPYVIESDEDNNSLTEETVVVARPANLVVTSISVPAQNFSGEKTTVTWTVRNDGAAVWSGTRRWTDTIWISPDPVFGHRARQIGSEVHVAGTGSRPRRELHRQHRGRHPRRLRRAVLPLRRHRPQRPGHARAEPVRAEERAQRLHPFLVRRTRLRGALGRRQRPTRRHRRHLPRAGPDDHPDRRLAGAVAVGT